jgi:hypothetical protein
LILTVGGVTIKADFGKFTQSRSFKQWFKCIYIAAALIIAALLYYGVNSILTLTVDPLTKLLYLLGMVFALGSVIWLLAYVFPKVFHEVFGMIGVKGSESEGNLPSKKEKVPNEAAKNVKVKEENKKAPMNQEAPQPEEESDSEKLRNEFKNRKL